MLRNVRILFTHFIKSFVFRVTLAANNCHFAAKHLPVAFITVEKQNIFCEERTKFLNKYEINS